MSRRPLVFAAAAVSLALAAGVTATASLASTASTASSTRSTVRTVADGQHLTVNCDPDATKVHVQCPDVYNPIQNFGYYVGHDEPGVWAYSTIPGSGNNSRWQLTLPKDPAPNPTPGAANYAFENHIAFWFGMNLCASQSFPEQISTCTPDSDSNIVDPKVSDQHAGSAFLELQFYPPGAELFPAGISCDATRWCAAMNVWSYYFNPVTGQGLNTTCRNALGGNELDNFAFVQRNGVPTGPPDPLHSTAATFTNNAQTMLMGQGDHVTITIHDTSDGLTTDVVDHANGQVGTMTASAANGFAQMNYAPDPSTQCTSTPYTYHPMYSTASPLTRATWTAYPYNIAYADETGHFSYCSQVDETSGTCVGQEGAPGNQHPADGDDFFCFGADQTSRIPIAGCTFTNNGFDGTPYLDDWPNGDLNRGTPVMFTSPLTGADYTQNYNQLALAGSQPFVEFGGGQQGCNIFTMTGCTLLPKTDTGTTAPFYPFFYTTREQGCSWGEGTDIPRLTVNDYGKQAEYGSYNTGVWYTGRNGTPFTYASNFLNTFSGNPCPAQVGLQGS